MSGNNFPKTFDKQGNPLTPTPLKIDLRDSHAIRRELAALYRDARAGHIDPADATKLGYLLDLLRKAYADEVLETRMETLERTLNTRKLKP